ncbi:hypothetical protein TYRP_005736 [Tyrophagus putrescentiae]|nr:hypothetical protein TYRP_005736 [Tyrophagus putrescentiae]
MIFCTVRSTQLNDTYYCFCRNYLSSSTFAAIFFCRVSSLSCSSVSSDNPSWAEPSAGETSSNLHRLLDAQIEHRLAHILLNPLRQLAHLVITGEALKKGRKNKAHNAIVGLSSDRPANTLRRVAHRIKGEKVILPYLVVLRQVLQPGLQYTGLRVHVGNAEHHHTPPQVVVKVDALADLAAGHRQQHRPSAILTGLHVVVERQTGLRGVLRLNEEQLVLLHRVDDALLVPAGDDLLHVEVAGEEADDAIRHHGGELHQQGAVVADDGGVVSRLKLRRHRHLVVALGDYQREDALPAEGHREGGRHYGREVEHLRVHLQRTERARGDHHRLEALKDGLDGDARIEAAKVQHRIGHVRRPILKGLNDERETAKVGADQRGKVAQQRQRRKVGDVVHLQRPDHRAEALGAETERLPLNGHSVVDVLEEGGRTLSGDVLHTQPRLDVLQQVLQEADKVLGGADVSGHRFGEDVRRQDGVGEEELGDLRVEQVVVAVDDDVRVGKGLAGGEVGAPALLAAVGLQVVDVVDAGGQGRFAAAVLFEALVEGAAIFEVPRFTCTFYVSPFFSVSVSRSASVLRPLMRSRHTVAHPVYRLAVLLSTGQWVNAEVLPRGKTEADDAALRAAILLGDVVVQLVQLLHHLLNLRNGSRAVDELLQLQRVLQLVGDDQSEQGDRLSGARGHLQDAVAPRVEALLQLAHVAELLRVDVIVGKEHLEVVDFEPREGRLIRGVL